MGSALIALAFCSSPAGLWSQRAQPPHATARRHEQARRRRRPGHQNSTPLHPAGFRVRRRLLDAGITQCSTNELHDSNQRPRILGQRAPQHAVRSQVQITAFSAAPATGFDVPAM